MHAKKIIVYSAITGDKDEPRSDGVFTFSKYNRFTDPRLNAKIYKVLPHLFLNTQYSIWVDGNVTLNVSPEYLVGLMEKDIAVFHHPERNCIYDEAHVCKEWGLDSREIINEQTKDYFEKGHKRKAGLGACYLIIRKHTEEINRLNEKWWAEITRHSVRDQISFPYVFRGKVHYLPAQHNKNRYFTRVAHKR